MTLVKILDANKQNDLVTYLTRVDIYGDRLFWIGLSDLEQDGLFLWEDGTTVTYSTWSSDEPNDHDGSSDCVHLDYANKRRLWTDSDCFIRNAYALCEKNYF